uniref:Uncharacterized protein n=1 Tax=Seriola lalandi dorsalis TaxID=1841481 RepID=A0A3B4WN95_SERLL
LMKMNSDVSDKCWHGCGKTGTLIHLLWHCPETKIFCQWVVDTLVLSFRFSSMVFFALILKVYSAKITQISPT